MGATLEDTLTVELEDLLDLDDVKCMSRHSEPGNLTCTGEVTHRMVMCRKPGGSPVCAGHTTHKLQVMHTYIPPAVCAGCGELARNCWHLIPV